jgi:hypothetical protein
MDSVGGRKVVVSALLLVVGVGVTLYVGDVPDGLLQLMSVIFGGFIVGNVGEHISGAVVSKAEALAAGASPSTPSAAVDTEALSKDISYVSQQVASFEAKLDSQAEGVAAVQQALTLIIKKYGIDK